MCEEHAEILLALESNHLAIDALGTRVTTGETNMKWVIRLMGAMVTLAAGTFVAVVGILVKLI